MKLTKTNGAEKSAFGINIIIRITTIAMTATATAAAAAATWS